MTPAASLQEVLELFEGWGSQRYDETVSQLDHALQTAALARADQASEPLIAAALLHDVGHLLELRAGGQADGHVEADLGHERTGVQYLAGIFGPEVTGPIALHVAAKRYRCHLEPSYETALSDGSRASLTRQGGPMSTAEADRFATHPAHDDAIRLRSWDDGGKIDDLNVAPLAQYRPLLERLAHRPF